MANKTNEYRKRRLNDLKDHVSALEKHVRDLESKLQLARDDVHYYKELSQSRINTRTHK
jgi:predicted  nucleic acid-binding Zn-ribbon protein